MVYEICPVFVVPMCFSCTTLCIVFSCFGPCHQTIWLFNNMQSCSAVVGSFLLLLLLCFPIICSLAALLLLRKHTIGCNFFWTRAIICSLLVHFSGLECLFKIFFGYLTNALCFLAVFLLLVCLDSQSYEGRRSYQPRLFFLRELRKFASRHSFSAKKRNKFEKGKLVVLLVFMYQQKNECNGLFLPFKKKSMWWFL